MPTLFALAGTILFHLRAFAALLVITPALYGLVIVMRRWWLVIAAAVFLCGGIAWLAFDPELYRLAQQLPAQMQPDARSLIGIAAGYVLLATLVRLSTLRLEWRGWERKSIKDIHVLGYLAPTVAAFIVVLAPLWPA